MESVTKTRLTDDVIDQMVKRTFGSGTTVLQAAELSDGWFNTAYSIELNDGRGVVLKVSPSDEVRTLRYEANMMEAEVAAMRTNFSRTIARKAVQHITRSIERRRTDSN
jgi:hypothetical protein